MNGKAIQSMETIPLLNQAPSDLGELADWLAELAPEQVFNVFVAAICASVADTGGEVNLGKLNRVLLVIKMKLDPAAADWKSRLLKALAAGSPVKLVDVFPVNDVRLGVLRALKDGRLSGFRIWKKNLGRKQGTAWHVAEEDTCGETK